MKRISGASLTGNGRYDIAGCELFSKFTRQQNEIEEEIGR